MNLHVKKGRIYGLLGRNGAGKTTTMKMLLGLTKPTSGNIKIFGKSMETNSKDILPHIGSLIESPGFYPNLTGTENLRIFAELRGLNKSKCVRDALEVVGLPYRDKKLFAEYSLSFIRELCDVQGKTILISSHILSEIELLADDIGIIDKGILLEEESMKELAKKNSRYVNFMVSDSQRAAEILRKEFECDDFQICDKNRLQLYNTTIPRSEITYVFVKQGLEITEVHLCEETLEDYFKRVTGGEGIA